ncbi:PUA-like domain-containing protein [Mycena leptocephala]|nr:PUA-like domain-containing protein [Mycena leptocephala]
METASSAPEKYWLLKAEPDSRTIKGKDVKFSVDDFEAAKTSPWEGVRNYEARNLMKEMKVGEKALFYHFNCKNPGIAAFAEVSKEAYPDNTAWDSSHPYYDPKSKQDDPKWFMVDLTFGSRAQHFHLALAPTGLEYLGDAGVAAIKGMDLVTRGRLSVQHVSEAAWTAVQQLASTGGWDALDISPAKKKSAESQESL